MSETGQKPNLSPKWIESNAYGIVKALQKNNHTAYLVGGCIRDLLVGIEPKDFDIVTSATPKEIRKVIRQAYIIGRRFKLVLVRRGRDQYEVSTFRRAPTEAEIKEDPDPYNLFGSPKADVKRRDFTVNALFYDPVKRKIIDYCGGMKDMDSKIIRMIGDPIERFEEDPIRIFRCIRLAHKIDFFMEDSIKAAIKPSLEFLAETPLPRRREEFLKIIRLKESSRAWVEFYERDILQYTTPELHKLLSKTLDLKVFSHHLHHIFSFNQIHTELLSPSELYINFMYALGKSQCQGNTSPEALSEWIKLDPIQDIMKNELGLFNAEIASVMSAFELMIPLADFELFSQKGERRRAGLLNQDQFSSAFELSMRDFIYSSQDVLNWHKATARD